MIRLKVVRSEEIKDEAYNEFLTEFLKIKIMQGNFEWYENGLIYLLNYDRGFIEQYMNRYAKGDFNEIESGDQAVIKREYIQKLSQKTLRDMDDF